MFFMFSSRRVFSCKDDVFELKLTTPVVNCDKNYCFVKPQLVGVVTFVFVWMRWWVDCVGGSCVM